MTAPDAKVLEALRASVRETERLRRHNRELTGALREPIAIVGMACRFPGGVSTPEGLWELVEAGGDGITRFPDNRGWDVEGLYDPDPDATGHTYSVQGGFLHGATGFDAGLFGIAPREALAMDPQQRLLLETAWEAFERTGIPPLSLRGSRTGVFVGGMRDDYGPPLQHPADGVEGHRLTGIAASVLSGRLSYVFGLEGPGLTVDTACSSSLVAVHLAAQSLRSGESSLALAGGVTVMSTPGTFVEFSRQRGLAPDGRCKSFAGAADGTGWSEGVGLLVLERLSDAVANGRQVLAVIRGSAVNQDGASNGLTAPNGPSQQRVIQAALTGAGLTPSDVDAVEAHGTGTALGDPIEAQALLATYGSVERDRPLWLGSIKSNLGHTQAAAGVAGIIKMVQAIRHGRLPATLHVDEPSPHVDWSSGAVELLTESRPWPEVDRPRRAGVSSFGISGTNAHVLLEQAPAHPAAEEPAVAAAGPVLLPLSAADEAGLRAQAERLASAVDSPADSAYALVTTRSPLRHRAVVVAADRDEARRGLEILARTGAADAVGVARETDLGFLFSGQGSQRVGMGRGLAAAYPVFAKAYGQALSLLDPGLRRVLWDGPAEELARTGFAQPGLFAVQVALGRLWESWGIVPSVVAGHSVGEIAAAHVAGIVSLQDAAALVSARARLMQALPDGGAMVSVAAAVEDIELPVGVSVAAVNGPSSTVVSGPAEAVADVERVWRDRVRTRRLRVSHAFHSALMEPMLAEFAEVVAGLEFGEPVVPMVSSVTGEPIVADAEYWVRQVREPVLFSAAVASMSGVDVFVEVGPDAALSSLGPLTVPDAVFVPSLRPDHDEVRSMLTALAGVWANGHEPDWPALLPAGARAVELPTYPFQHRDYWLLDTATVDVAAAGLEPVGHPLLGAELRRADGGGTILSGRLGTDTHPWLADHTVLSTVVLPGTALVELALAAGDRTDAPALAELTLDVPMVLPDRGGLAVQVTVGPSDEAGRRTVSVAARTDDATDWTTHATGVLTAAVPPAGEVPARSGDPIDVEDLYDDLAAGGLDYGPVFRGLRAAWRDGASVHAEVALPDGTDVDGYAVHPALFDAGLHAAALALDTGDGRPRLPFAWSGVTVHATGATALRVTVTPAGPDTLTLVAADPTGAPVVTVDRLRLRAAPEATGPARSAALFTVDMVPLAGSTADPVAAVVLGDPVADLPAVPELDALAATVEPPAAVLHRAGPVADVLGLLQDWLARPEWEAVPLVLLDPEPAVRGLVRSAQAEHPGRLVLLDGTVTAALLAAVLAAGEPEVSVRDGVPHVPRLTAVDTPQSPVDDGYAAGTVLITGGTGAVGGALARHLVTARGARRLVLTNRRGPDAAADLVAELTGLGAEVTVVACDTADRDAVARLVAEHPPTAVVHAAGVLDDGVLTALTRDRLAAVLAPKADGARILDELTRELPLTRFVLVSSASGVLGSPGQGNYAAANAVLDALAADRREAGLPAQSVAWGPWAVDGGMAGGVARQARLSRSGVLPFAPAEALAAFDAADAHGGAAVVAVRLDAAALRTAPGPLPAVLRGLVRRSARRVAATAGTGSALADRLAGLSADDQLVALRDVVVSEVAAALGHDTAAAVDPLRGFAELGVDSLTAVDVRNRLVGTTGVALAAAAVFDYPTPAALAAYLRDELTGSGAATAAAGPVATDEPVAIVGMACRYPGGVSDPDGLWELLVEGRDGITPFPTDRGWDAQGLYDPDPDRAGHTYSVEGGFLHDAADFDAGLFGISPREALAMDPQQRLLLESAWEAFERAGIAPSSLRGSRTGVFAGLMYHEYVSRLPGLPADIEGYVGTGNTGSVATGRLSYVFGLEGPAVTVDTACSSSLVAVHLAAQSLRSGESTLALAGGVTVMSTPGTFVEFSRQRGLAPDGRCKSFAGAADGTGWSEGVGLLVLERLSDAVANGHEVLAVVRGSAVNQDGASNGLAAPNGPSQQRVIRAALAAAGLEPSGVDAVEAHGTGTALGDPIEAQALLATYGSVERDQPLWLGSVKSNLGHTQAAAGVAGIIKMVQAIRYGVLPATLHVDEPSPHVDWSSGAVELLTESRAWPEVDRPRRAGVSSFGISGTNAHVLLEQAPAGTPAEPGTAPAAVPLVLSAAGDAALRAQAAALESAMDDPAAAGLTLATGRSALEHRAVVVGTDRAELRAGLAALAAGGPAPRLVTGTAGAPGHPVFVFPGQGAQWAGMGAALLVESPVFAGRLGECAAALEPFVEWSLVDAVRGESDRVDVVQPVLWAMMVSLAAVWESLGVRPAAVLGHSQGEIAAAVVAGALSLQDGARVVALRSRALLDLPPGGGMLSVALGTADLTDLPAGVSVAAGNGPRSTVLSGPRDALEELRGRLDAAGTRVRFVPVDYASHSAQVEAIEDRLRADLADLTPRRPEVPYVSGLTGGLLDPDTDLDADYWYENLRRTVRFEDATRGLLAAGRRVFVEVSPHPVLAVGLQETLDEQPGAYALGTLRRDDGGLATMLLSAGEAWTRGVPVDWARAFDGAGARIADLPTYPFQRRRYWLDLPEPVAGGDDAEFWSAVDRGDAAALAAALRVEPDAVDGLLPALADRRRRRQRRSDVDGWRYRIGWAPRPVPTAGLTGRWAVVAADDRTPDRDAAEQALLDRGAEIVDLPDADGVLSLLGLDDRPHPGHPDVPAGLAGTVELLRTLPAGARLWTVTAGAVSTGPADPLTAPARAAVWGLGRVAALEQPRSWGGLVDIDPDAGDGWDTVAALLADPGEEDQLAVRGRTVLARRLSRAPLAGRAPTRDWRPSGTVLVTGAGGPLARAATGWLLAGGAERVLLDAADADLEDDDRVAVADGSEQLTAIVHAQDEPRAGLLADLDAAGLAAALAGKVTGALRLHEQAHDVRDFVLFSSVAGVWGGSGQGGYAAATAWLDALAQHRRAGGLPATSVAWGLWDVDPADPVERDRREQLRRRGITPMVPDAALAALGEVLEQDESTVVVADVDWSRFSPAFTGLRASPLLSGVPEAAPAPEPAVEPSRMDGLSPEDLVMLVRRETAAVLGHDGTQDVDPRRAFGELGFDSLAAVSLRNRLGAATGRTLPATLVFDHPSPAAVAAYLAEQLAPAAAAGDTDPDLEAVRARLAVDRERVSAGLRLLLAELDAAPVDGGGVADSVRDASDEELFAFIDSQLGSD